MLRAFWNCAPASPAAELTSDLCPRPAWGQLGRSRAAGARGWRGSGRGSLVDGEGAARTGTTRQPKARPGPLEEGARGFPFVLPPSAFRSPRTRVSRAQPTTGLLWRGTALSRGGEDRRAHCHSSPRDDRRHRPRALGVRSSGRAPGTAPGFGAQLESLGRFILAFIVFPSGQ